MIILLAMIVLQVLAHQNLIINGGFQEYPLTLTTTMHVFSQYEYSLISPDGFWYAIFMNGTETQFKVRNRQVGETNHLLNILEQDQQCWVCQNVELQVNKKYNIQFEYSRDTHISDSKIQIFINAQIISQFFFRDPGFYEQIIIATQQSNDLCFYSPRLVGVNWNDSVMLDNVKLIEYVKYIDVKFDTNEQLINKKQICLKSNLSLDLQQISVFNSTQVTLGKKRIKKPQPQIINNKLAFCFPTQEIQQFGNNLIIILPNQQYKDQEQNLVIFQTQVGYIPKSISKTIFWQITIPQQQQNTLCIQSDFTIGKEFQRQFDKMKVKYGQEQINNFEIQILSNRVKACFEITKQHTTQQSIQVDMEDVQILTQDTYYYKFKVVQSETPFIIVNEEDSLSWLNQETINGGIQTLNDAGSLVVAAVSFSFMFRFLSLPNMMLLYIFLDIQLLNTGVRKFFEQFANILLRNGMIATILSMMEVPVPEFLQKQLYIPNKIPQQVPKKGSHFTILGISTQSSKLCVDDSVVMLTNILKICFVWAVGVCLSKKQMFAKFINPQELGSESYKAIVYEIIAPAPLWTLVSGIILSAEQDNVNATNFIDKLNTSFLVGIPIVLLLIGVSWFRHCRIDKALKDLKKQEEKAEKVMERKMDRIELLDILQYILLGLFVGFQSLLVFFLVGNLFCIYSFYELITNLHLSFQCIVMAAKKCFEAVIHFSFFFLLCLELILEQTESPDIQLVIISVANDLSVGIFYAYLLGCLTMALLFVVEIIIMLYKFVCFWWKVCTRKNTVVNWQEYSVQQQPKNKSNNINNKQIYQIIQPQFFIVKNSTAIHYRNNKIVTKKTIGAGKDLLEFRDLKWQE